jgi:hypothetical protein
MRKLVLIVVDGLTPTILRHFGIDPPIYSTVPEIAA